MRNRGPLVAAGAGVALIIVMVVGMILPRASQIRERQQEVEKARQQGSSLRLEVQQLEATAKGAKKTRKQMSHLEAQVPATSDLPGLIQQLNATASETGVDFLSVAPGQPTASPTGTFSVVPVQVSIVGRFFAVDQYLFELESLPRASKVTNLAVAPGPDALPQLQVTASVEFFTSDLSAGPGSAPGPTTVVPGAAPAPQGQTTGTEEQPGATPSPTAGG